MGSIMDLNNLDLSKIDPSKFPSAKPPGDIQPNFENPESRATATIVFITIFTCLMIVIVSLRMYTKAVVVKQWHWDDFFCGLGTLLAVSYVGMIIFVFSEGLGPHQWNVPLSTFLNNNTFRVLQAIYKTYGFVITSAKLSILLLYFRLFNVYRTFSVLIHIGIWFHVTIFVIPSTVSFTLCTKPTAIEYLKCSPTLTRVAFVTSLGGVIGDFYILIIPILAVRKLSLNNKRKLGVLTVFSTGLLACGAGLSGLLVRVAQREHMSDLSWWLSPLLILTVLEAHIALMVSCMPILPRWLKHVRESDTYKSITRRFRSSQSISSSESNDEKHISPISPISPMSPVAAQGEDDWQKMPSLVMMTTEVECRV